jgi:hypothetical protein
MVPGGALRGTGYPFVDILRLIRLIALPDLHVETAAELNLG